MRFCWTTLQVSDLDASLKFYAELLDLGPASCFGPPEHRIAMLGDDLGTKLELIAGGAVPSPAGQGVSMGFAPEDLDAMIEKVRAAGCAVQGPVSPNPGIRFFFVQDPDGYTIQLLEQK